ncbi:MAG: hypothetical protein ACJASJ_000947 [Candidatus Azotimanducaceae bacterium]|jgi:hypothetical protein
MGACLIGRALTPCARATAALLLMPCGEVQGRPSFELMGWFVMGASRDVSEAVRT